MSRIHVAVGVVCDQNQRVLIAKRVNSSFQANLWEFPGGKVEAGESGFQGLRRELYEELGISITEATPLINIPFEYSDRSVLLDVWKVSEFTGEPFGKEGQPVRWVESEELKQIDFPEANKAIITALQMPRKLAVTGDSSDVQTFYQKLNTAKQRGAEGVLIRSLPQAEVLPIEAAIEQAKTVGLLPIVHCRLMAGQTFKSRPDFALHLDSISLKALNQKPAEYPLVGASCHTPEELAKAQSLGCDYVFLSPVMKTSSHPDQTPLGWSQFGALVAQTKIPVYALGGLKSGDLSMALGMGAQGVACLSDFWS